MMGQGAAAANPAVFVLSFRQRDGLSSALAREGWHVVAARRADGAASRFQTSGAGVAVVDARGAIDDGLDAVRAMAPAVEARGGALLTLLSKNDVARIAGFFDAGATHFMVSPIGATELSQAVRFARRHSERMGGGWEAHVGAPRDALGWRWDPALSSFQMTAALRRLLHLRGDAGPLALFRALPPGARAMALAAARRLSGTTPSTAFATDLAGVGRVVGHLQRDPRSGRMHGLVEPLGITPDAGAAMREAFEELGDEADARRWIDRRLRFGEPVVALLVAVGGVDVVNHAYGRDAGDRLLSVAARRIRDAVRAILPRRAMIARLGGADFVVALPLEDAERAGAVAQAVQDHLSRPFAAGDRVATLTVRQAAVEPEAGEDAAAVLRRGRDRLMRPQAGNASIGPRTDDAEGSTERLAGEIHRAIGAGEIDIVFQPQVAIASGAIVGVEALARWRHPVLGEVGAERLLAAAEHADLGIALSDAIQRRALDAAAAWPPALGNLRLSINVTAQDVGRPGFLDLLLDRIDASGFPRSRLTVEITESGLMTELGEAARLLAALRVAGCRVAIDDFGTGYSSLAYLKALPLDYLKIDRRLAQDITGSHRDRVVVRGVIDMARSLGLAVIAEGIETEEQLDLLAQEGCQYYQGFLCARALSTEALTELIATRCTTRAT